MQDSPSRQTILVWDLPLRVFHWLLAGSFAGAFLTAESERWRDVHAILGYTALTLVIFRIAWGIFGTRYARFVAMSPSPRKAIAYLQSLFAGRPRHHVGHNPAGSIAIFALLGLAAASALTGLAAYAQVGAEWLDELHESIANAMLAVVVVHIAGVVVGSLAHRENLAVAMLTGRKRGGRDAGIRGPRRLVAAALLAVVLGLWTGLVPTPGLDLQRPLISISALTHPQAHADRKHD